MKRWLGYLWLVGGGVLVVWLVRVVGADAVWQHVRQLGWWTLWIVAAYALVYTWDAAGWAWALRPELINRIGLWELFRVRLSGMAVNYTTPSAYLAGEALKVRLLKLRSGCTAGDVLPSIVVAKTTLVMAEVVFVALASTLAIATLGMQTEWARALGGVVLLGLMIVGILLALQWRGLFGSLFGWVQRLARRLQGVGQSVATMDQVDQAIRDYYRQHPRRVALSVACHLMGWLCGVLEVWLFCHWMQLPVSLATAVVIEACSQTVKALTFFIPGSIGAQEGSHVAIMAAVGQPPAMGLALSAVKRVREFVWISLGLSWWCWAEYRATGRPVRLSNPISMEVADGP